MNATLLELPVETRGTPVSCENCPALQRLERALTQLQRDFRREVGYWRSRHADAVKRIEQLKDELDQAQGQIRSLQAKLFGRKSEKSACRDRSNVLFDPEDTSAAAKKRGAEPGHAGHPRRDYSHLPVAEECISLPEASGMCPTCGKPVAWMGTTEDSELLEIDVRAYRRRIRRRRYRPTCDCDPARRTLVAPPPPKLIPKGNYGISIWVHVLLDKYSSYRPTERLLGQLALYDLDLPAGTVNDGLKRIEPMLQPIYEALGERNRLGGLHQADETGAGVLLGPCAARLCGSGQELVGVEALGTFLAASHSTRLPGKSAAAVPSARLGEVSRTRGLVATGGGGDAC
jgi:transposase